MATITLRWAPVTRWTPSDRVTVDWFALGNAAYPKGIWYWEPYHGRLVQ